MQFETKRLPATDFSRIHAGYTIQLHHEGTTVDATFFGFFYYNRNS